MNSSIFPSPNPNTFSVLRPIPQKPLCASNLSKKYQFAPIIAKSPMFMDSMPYFSSLLERSEMTKKEGSSFSKQPEYHHHPLNLKFEKYLIGKPKNISITENFFNHENGGNDIRNSVGTFLFGSLLNQETPIKKEEEEPSAFKTTVSKNLYQLETSQKRFKCSSSKKNISDGSPAKSSKSIKSQTSTSVIKKLKSESNHVMSVTNNFFFQFHNQKESKKRNSYPNCSIMLDETIPAGPSFIQHKRRREKSWNTKAKKLKKKDKTQETYLLNQISIDNISISKFPLISLSDSELSVELLTRMIATENFFEVVEKYYNKVPVLDEEMMNNKSFIKQFNKEKEKINNDLYLIEENIDEQRPYTVLRNYYKQIKESIQAIQKNYIGKKKNILNEVEREKLKKLIYSCNEISNIMTDFKKSGMRKKRATKPKKKQQHYKNYLCEFCNKAYPNGQGLGGHISRIHHNQSEKYREKIRIRNNRVDKRQRIYEIKKTLFNRYGYDLDQMNTKTEKHLIQKFMKDNRAEYYKIKKEEQKKSNALKKKENYVELIDNDSDVDINAEENGIDINKNDK